LNLKLEHEYKRIVAFISDLHVGSRFAVFPKGFHGKEGSNISRSMNQGQRDLLKYFKNFTRKCDELKVDTIFIVGDVVAGTNPKEQGLFMMTSDLDEQVDASVKLLEPLCEGRKVGVWSGTQYHESRDYRIHGTIARALGGEFFGNIANIKLIPSNKVVNITHPASSALVYPETPMSRDMLFFKEAEALGKIPKVDVIVRGHRHMFCHIHKNAIHYIHLPCWQSFVPYEGALKNYSRWQPDLGGVILLIDMEDRARVFHYLYPNVHIVDRVVER